jgi:hypothetical protein
MNEQEMNEASNEEILETYLNQKEMRFEGDRGLENLNTLVKDIGYKSHGFKYGSSLETFLSDNPACQEAIIEFIRTEMNKDWRDGLSDELELSEEEEEEQTRRDEKNGLYSDKEDIAN